MFSLVNTIYCQKWPPQQRCSVKKDFLKNFVNFIGKHLCCLESLFNKFAGPAPIFTARKTIFSFSRRPEKMVFPKKSNWNMIFLVLSGKMIFLFPKIWSYTLGGKWKTIFLKKYTEIYFLQTFWKDGLSKKGRASTWSFLCYLERWYFFFRKHDLFSPDRKWKTVFPRKYMETWCIAQWRKTGNLIYRIEVWLLPKFIRLEIFYNK